MGLINADLSGIVISLESEQACCMHNSQIQNLSLASKLNTNSILLIFASFEQNPTNIIIQFHNFLRIGMKVTYCDKDREGTIIIGSLFFSKCHNVNVYFFCRFNSFFFGIRID